jgi:hypothetical protein
MWKKVLKQGTSQLLQHSVAVSEWASISCVDLCRKMWKMCARVSKVVEQQEMFAWFETTQTRV